MQSEMSFPKYKAAVVQSNPVFLDLEPTLKKAVTYIDEAASNGAKLIAFPEAYLPAYSYWTFFNTPFQGTEFWERLYKNSVEIPGPAIRVLSEACRRNQVYLCISGTEREGGSLYLTQFWFNTKGDLIGKHRKVKPTVGERYIWGEGDGSTMTVFDTELGRLGGLQCWEHLVPLNIAAMCSLQPQVHVSGWPGLFAGPGCDGGVLGTDGSDVPTRYLAMACQTWVLQASQYYSPEMLDIVAKDGKIDPEQYRILTQYGGASSAIYDPSGIKVTQDIPRNEDCIIYAEIDLNKNLVAKYWCDPAGHYSSKALRLQFNMNPLTPTEKIGDSNQEILTFERLQEKKPAARSGK